MPAMQGYNERIAAQETLEFMRTLAAKVERYHARYFGLWKPYRIEGTYSPLGSMGEDRPPSLAGTYSLELGGRRALRFLSRGEWLERDVLQGGKKITLAFCTFHRADWDDTPGMRSVVCMEYIPPLLPVFFRDEIRSFSKMMFGCERVTFYQKRAFARAAGLY